MFCDVNFMYRLYHDCARTLKRSLAGKLAIVQLSSGLVLLAIPRGLPVPSRVSRVLACLVVRVHATLPVSCTVLLIYLLTYLQYSPFITSHTHDIFSVGPRNFFRGKTENHAWHDDLPHVEKGFDMPRNSHAWQSKPLPHVANI